MASADLDYEDQEGSAPTPVRLAYQGRDILLMPGTYLIGRSASCHVVLEDPLVSRRHARIRVSPDGSTLEDLGSINGVFLNGRRVTTPHPVENDDHIDIGNARFVFQVGGVGYSRRPSGSHALNLDTLNGADPVVPAEDRVAVPTPESSTREVDGIMMMSAIAQRSIDAGRMREAEEMLQQHLARVMDEACDQHAVEPATIESAVGAGLSLAMGSGKGRWFDYSIELLWRTGHECDDRLLGRLEQAASAVGEIDVELLRRYAVVVHGTSPGFEQLRAAQRLDTIARSAKQTR